jgi:RNA polymerase sigma-70 factor (ECF subfamily)
MRNITSPKEPLQTSGTEAAGGLEFSALVRQYSDCVYNHAYRMLGNREEAEEATMDVFLKIHHGLADFRGNAQLSSWIWRITVNVCLSRRARKSVQTVFMEVEKIEGIVVDIEPASNPEELFMKEESREQLARLIAELPEQEAAAITLFYLEGMKYEEIAVILGLPSGTVATALHRGRERLRRKMIGERVIK